MANSKARVWDISDEAKATPLLLVGEKVLRNLKGGGAGQKRHRSQVPTDPSSQNWNNLSSRINKLMSEYNLKANRTQPMQIETDT